MFTNVMGVSLTNSALLIVHSLMTVKPGKRMSLSWFRYVYDVILPDKFGEFLIMYFPIMCTFKKKLFESNMKFSSQDISFHLFTILKSFFLYPCEIKLSRIDLLVISDKEFSYFFFKKSLIPNLSLLSIWIFLSLTFCRSSYNFTHCGKTAFYIFNRFFFHGQHFFIKRLHFCI